MKCFRWIIIMIFLICPLSVFASTNTFTRTKDKPLVPPDIIVKEDNIQDILKTPAVSAVEKVYDYADLYTEQQERDLYKQISSFVEDSNIDVVIVTTKNLNGYEIKDYAYNFYDYNDFRIEGVIFVISLEGSVPEIYMGNSGDSTGRVVTTYTKARIRQTLEYVYKDISIGNYYSATSNFVKIIKGFYDIDRNGDYYVGEDGSIVRNLPWTEIIILALAVSFIIVILCVFQIRNNNHISSKYNLGNLIDDTTLTVKLNSDDYLESVYQKKK